MHKMQAPSAIHTDNVLPNPKTGPLDSRLYHILQGIARWMDKYYIDPILGFLLPGGIGDIASLIMAVPFVFFSLFVAKSFSLALTIINHTLWDILIGLIPFFVGDILDITSRPFMRNMQLIEGYIKGDKHTIRHVRKHVVGTLAAIVLCCVLIWFMIKAALWFGNWLWGLF